MGQGQPFARPHAVGEGGAAGGAGGAFQAKAAVALDRDGAHFQRHSQRGAEAFAMGLPGIGGGVQTMVYVQRAQSARAVVGQSG